MKISTSQNRIKSQIHGFSSSWFMAIVRLIIAANHLVVDFLMSKLGLDVRLESIPPIAWFQHEEQMNAVNNRPAPLVISSPDALADVLAII